jgi:hypothetical protein
MIKIRRKYFRKPRRKKEVKNAKEQARCEICGK